MNKSISKSSKSESIAPVSDKKSKKVEEVIAPVEEKVVKKGKKSTTEVVESAVVEKPKKGKKAAAVVESAEAPAAEKPKRGKKAAAEVVDAAAEAGETTETKRRREVTRETVDAEFDSIIESIHARLETVTADEKKSGIAKLLRSLHKRVKILKGDTARISKQRTRTARANNTTSGFMKPVKISGDMATFTGWDSTQLRSRVEVTKFICDYVKTHNLQNPEDKRQIVPDVKLAKLLSYDKKKEEKPLTYYYLQQKIQPHFLGSAASV